jgi:DNA-binding MarR family transcriptional regulator
MSDMPDQDLKIDYEVIEGLFFAYQSFVSDPDILLKQFKFGRAHHRVIHFVHRKPGLTVAELLEILQITKQSLAKVLKQLIETGYISQETNSDDRRQRHLYVTQNGQKLALTLSQQQSKRISLALKDMKPEDRQAVLKFLNGMIDK